MFRHYRSFFSELNIFHMLQKAIYIFLACLFLWQAQLSAQSVDLTAPVPRDPAIRHGVLDNGLTYYIRHNEQPKERAGFYIYQNVGAVLETDEQNGLAHFLEHMAFNGTKHFPGKTMLHTLESHGIQFGRDINAYTTRNETVYNLSRIPTGKKGLVDTCLLVLRDWCDDLLLTEEEIDAERGVITEEWRTKQGSQKRISKQMAPARYNNSIYSYRDVIGDLNVVQKHKPEVLRKFYHDWYRTDLQAIAIVGDIDVDEVEKKVKALFSSIKAIDNAKERGFAEIPDNEEPLYVLATDEGADKSSLSITVRRRQKTDNTQGNLRKGFVNHCFNSMIGNRIGEYMQQNDAAYLAAGIRIGGFARGYGSLSLYATAKKAKEAEALTGIYTEFERVRRYGFTHIELERIKKSMLSGIENSYKRSNLTNNDAYCKAIKNDYLLGSIVPSSEFSYRFAKEVIPTITVEEVSALAGEWMTAKNQVWTVSGPTNKRIHLTKEQMAAVIENVKSSEITSYVSTDSEHDALLTELPSGGKIVAEKYLAPFDAKEWTLSNGAKVVYRHADYEKESVAINAFSYGGMSRYEAKDLPSAANADGFVGNYGIGNLDAIAYSRIMTGVSAGTKVSINNYSESVSGSSTPEKFETLMQLIYMRFEKPRFDREIYERLMKRNYETLASSRKSPENIKSDTLAYIYSQGHERNRKYCKAYLDDMDFDRMCEIYRDRFADASDFTFFIVGNIDEQTAKTMAEKYIGAIKDAVREDKWIDRKVEFPKGKHEKEISLPMTANRASVVIKMKADEKYSRKSIIYQSILSSILNLRFTENIREKEGGTYGVSVRPSVGRIPTNTTGLSIMFDCDPAKAKHLKGLVYKELEIIRKTVREDDLKKVVLNLKKNNEQAKPHNSYWMGALQTYYTTGFNRLESSYFDDIVNNVTTKDIAKAAKKFMKKANVVDIIFEPKKK